MTNVLSHRHRRVRHMRSLRADPTRNRKARVRARGLRLARRLKAASA